MGYVLVLVAIGAVFSALIHNMSRMQQIRAGDSTGDYVAEVWMEWEICQGSTLYRARFTSPERAAKAASWAARALDDILPHTFTAEYSNGTRYQESLDFALNYGVRKLIGRERTAGVECIWSPAMPGTVNFKGEHPSMHPSLGVQT